MPRITSWLEVERRLTNYNTAIKGIETTLVKVNNSRNMMLHALIINLKDLLESQSDISLWFYNEDEPTTSNEPYILWTTPSEHYGDIFYSRTKGTIYQFNNGVWKQLQDATLLNAMALTNSKLESTDHERKVFLVDPVPPYNSGDWWIQGDGTLYICQISRVDGTRQPNDWIDSLKYAEAVAKEQDNILEVLKGTVIATTDSAVTYLDKATNTTTTISGNSIKTGELISNNYLTNTRGMLISLDNGTITSKYFKVDEYGNITATGGTIGGYSINSTKLSNSFSAKYNYDVYDARLALAIAVGNIEDTYGVLTDVLDYDNSGTIDSFDASKILQIINGTLTNNHYVSGSIELNSRDPKHCIAVKNGSYTVCSMGMGGIDTVALVTNAFYCGRNSGTTIYGCSIDSSGNIKTTGSITSNGISISSLASRISSLESRVSALEV